MDFCYQPILNPIETVRLHLRQFSLADAPAVQQLAGHRDVAKTTLNIPHPYEDGMAEDWIKRQGDSIESGKMVVYAITLRYEATLVGAISLAIHKGSQWGELGYWIGKPYWNKGYCSEAAKAVVNYGFEELGLNRIQARHMLSNPASGRVMQKLSMRYEGTHRQAAFKFGSFDDLLMYAVLRSEYGSYFG